MIYFQILIIINYYDDLETNHANTYISPSYSLLKTIHIYHKTFGDPLNVLHIAGVKFRYLNTNYTKKIKFHLKIVLVCDLQQESYYEQCLLQAYCHAKQYVTGSVASANCMSIASTPTPVGLCEHEVVYRHVAGRWWVPQPL